MRVKLFRNEILSSGIEKVDPKFQWVDFRCSKMSIFINDSLSLIKFKSIKNIFKQGKWDYFYTSWSWSFFNFYHPQRLLVKHCTAPESDNSKFQHLHILLYTLMCILIRIRPLLIAKRSIFLWNIIDFKIDEIRRWKSHTNNLQ